MSPTPTAPSTDILTTLASLRKSAGLSQAQVASKVEVDATRISKIENGVYPPSDGELQSILGAIGTEEAEQFASFLEMDWTYLDRPRYDHPNRESLVVAENALRALQALRARSVSGLVTARLDLLSEQLLAHAHHLERTDYKVALIGEIGVGKTTVLCVLTGLVLGNGIGDGQIVLETGPGRTTLCDVQVEQGEEVRLVIEPHSSDDVMDYAREFCEGVWVRHIEPNESSEVAGVPQEMDRALRNMTGLVRPRRQKAKPGQPRPPAPTDPAVVLARDSGTLEAFVSAVWLRLDLARRTERVIACPPSEQEPLAWLAKTFRKVNNGRHERVSLPKLVRAVVTRPPLDLGPYSVALVDTKGLDSTLSRPDLREHRDDERTLVVLCTGFKDAPSASGEAFLRHGVEEGAKPGILERCSLLVLPKHREAMEMKDDSGYTAESFEEGYDLRRDQIEAELSKLEVAGLQVSFVDATRQEDVGQAIGELGTYLRAVVQGHRDAVVQLRRAVDEAAANHEKQASEAAHERMRQQLRAFISRRAQLPSRKKPTHLRLVQDIGSSHQRTVWASARRNGNWRNLYAPHELAAGAAVDARARTRQAFHGLREILDNMLHDPDLAPVHEYVKTLHGSVGNWERAFLARARDVGQLTYRSRLQQANSMWTTCQGLYGKGGGYRQGVARTVRQWFEASAQAKLETLADTRLQGAWDDEVVEKLRAFVGDEE